PTPSCPSRCPPLPRLSASRQSRVACSPFCPQAISPGCPFRRQAVREVSDSPARPSELRLLDQTFILLRQQMALHLCHSIHGDTHHNEQRGAAEIERQGRITDH